MPPTRPLRPWHVLVEKAHTACEDAHRSVLASQDKLAHLQATEKRLRGMLNDYRVRYQQQLRQGQLMGDQINSQRFIQQLQQLHVHSLRELAQCQLQCQQLQQRLATARREHEKMKKLVEQERARESQWQAAVEAKRLDEMAVMRFRLQQL